MSPARSQSRVRGQRRRPRRTAILVLAISAAASLLLAGCGASDGDEGPAAFPPVEHMTSSETAWLAEIDTLLDQRDAGFQNVFADAARLRDGPDALRHATRLRADRVQGMRGSL